MEFGMMENLVNYHLINQDLELNHLIVEILFGMVVSF